MMKLKIKTRAAATLFVAAALVFTTSCTKDDASPSQNNPIDQTEYKIVTDKEVKDEITRAAENMPSIAWYNKTMDKVIVYNPKDHSKSFNFSDPSSGWNFTSNDGIHWTENPAGGGVIFVSQGAFGSGGGSGTVMAGKTKLDITMAICFSADDEALGFGGMDMGQFNKISGVIGIAADLKALQNEDFNESEIGDFFKGYAYYVVFDSPAKGKYPIINYTEEVDSYDFDENNFKRKGFSIVLGLTGKKVGFYFSKSGTLNVSGGSMDFSGKYYGYEIDFRLFEDPNAEYDEPEFSEVTGYGEMGCD